MDEGEPMRTEHEPRPWDGGDAEAELRALIPRLRGIDDTPAPTPAFVLRLEDDLMAMSREAPGRLVTRNATPLNDDVSGRRVRPAARRRDGHSGWPITAALAAAVLLLAIGVGFAANRRPPADDGATSPRLVAGQDGPSTPISTGCRVEPRAKPIPTGGFLATAGLRGTPARSLIAPEDVTPSSSDGTGPPAMTEAALPTGIPADAEALGEIAAAFDQFLVCASEDRFSESLLSFYSDDYFRRPSTIDGGTAISYWAPPPGLEGGGQALGVRDARVLSDGRVGAIVEGPFVSGFFVFVDADPVWQIDEWVLLLDDVGDVESVGTPTAEDRAIGVGVSARCGPTPIDDGGSSIAVEGRTISAAIVASADRAFRPAEVTMAGNLPLNVTLLNCGPDRVGFVIDELGIDQVVDPGQTYAISFQAPPGSYEFYSDLSNQREAGLSGTLRMVDQGTPTP